MKLKNKLVSTLKQLEITKKFVNHNIKIFKNTGKTSQNIILVELHKLRELIILNSYLSNILATKHNAKIFAFNSKFFKNYANYFAFYFKKIFNLDYFKVYRSFNVTNFFYPKRNIKLEKKEIEKTFIKLKTKSDIFDIQILGISVGDLIYDSYLREYMLPTIDIKNKKLLSHFFKFYSLFFFWKNYFENYTVKAVIIHDASYEYGIISRIASSKNIPTYVGAETRLHKLDKNHINIFEMQEYRKQFNLFSDEEKITRREKAKYLVNLKFSGRKTIENKVSNLPETKLFGDIVFKDKVIKNKSKTNCLIAAHHFSDAPNAWGRLLFDDFYDWIDFLGKLSQDLDYDWYIKFHPMDQKDNLETIKHFMKKYKKFSIIDAEISHKQLISEGINLVLTGFGTIGFEYAYYDIPVINASLNNPHISFDFNHHPTNLSEYKNAIINYKSLNINFNKDQLYEYFYMRYLNNFYLYPDELSKNRDIEAFDDHTIKVYDRWLSLYNHKIDKDLRNKIKKFIDSNKFKFDNEIEI